MSIGRRLMNMARAELNSLLDVAAKHGGDDDGDGDGAPLEGYSVEELEEEIERRRRAHQEVEDAIHGRKTPEAPPRPRTGARSAGGTRGAGAGGRGGGSGGGLTGEALKIHKAYASLEVVAGSDFETVRKSYRALMRKYHPDHHTESPEKQKAANEVAQRLTEAYKLLEKTLRK